MKDILSEVIADYNKATGYLSKGKPEKGISLFKKVLNRYECKEAYTNMGNCYRLLGEDKKMFECYKKSLEPSVPFLDKTSRTDEHAMNNLGLAHFMYGEDDKALACYNVAVKKNPEFWEAWWNSATATLRKASAGSVELFPKGWELYKARFLKGDPVTVKNDREGLVYWDGVSSAETMIVLAEQGIGDSIMWGRFLPLLKEKFARVVVQCDDSCKEIFTGYETTYHTSSVETSSAVAYPFCGLASLFDYIPPGDWLKGKFETHEFDKSKLNVGIVWAGSSTHANDRYRSVPIGYFRRLAKYCNLYSLSPGFKDNGFVMGLPIKTWADTAKYINGLDLVIGVDTSVMHMVGSLGCEGWLLQPYKETDFRWGRAYKAGEDCPVSGKSVWYDSIRVFNNPQSWEFVFRNVENEISKRALG